MSVGFGNTSRLPDIQDIFNVYLNGGVKSVLNNAERAENVKLVMLINYILFQYALKFSSIRIKHHVGRRFNLQTVLFTQWTQISIKNSMGKELDQHVGRLALDEKVNMHNAAAVNSHGEVIVKSDNHSIRAISRTGEDKVIELEEPKEFDEVKDHCVEGLAIDKDDKVYVLRFLATKRDILLRCIYWTGITMSYTHVD